jgi:hypothetical protein
MGIPLWFSWAGGGDEPEVAILGFRLAAARLHIEHQECGLPIPDFRFKALPASLIATEIPRLPDARRRTPDVTACVVMAPTTCARAVLAPALAAASGAPLIPHALRPARPIAVTTSAPRAIAPAASVPFPPAAVASAAATSAVLGVGDPGLPVAKDRLQIAQERYGQQVQQQDCQVSHGPLHRLVTPHGGSLSV